jgi:hypothetical protein
MVAIPLLFVSFSHVRTNPFSISSFLPNRNLLQHQRFLKPPTNIITNHKQSPRCVSNVRYYSDIKEFRIAKFLGKEGTIKDVNEFPQYVDDPNSTVFYTYYNKKDMRGLQSINIFLFLFACFCFYFFLSVFQAKKKLAKVEKVQNEVLERTVVALCKGETLNGNNDFVKLRTQLDDYNFGEKDLLSFGEVFQLCAVSSLLIISVYFSKYVF